MPLVLDCNIQNELCTVYCTMLTGCSEYCTVETLLDTWPKQGRVSALQGASRDTGEHTGLPGSCRQDSPRQATVSPTRPAAPCSEARSGGEGKMTSDQEILLECDQNPGRLQFSQ